MSMIHEAMVGCALGGERGQAQDFTV